MSIKLKYLMYGINRNISKTERISNFKKIKNEFGLYFNLISRTTFQKIDFLLLDNSYFKLLDTFIIFRK